MKTVHQWIKEGLSKEYQASEESVFHVGNGYLGVRGAFEEGNGQSQVETIRGCYINGFYETVPYSYPEKLPGFPEKGERIVALPSVQDMSFSFDGEMFALNSGKILHFARILDMDQGVYRREVTWLSPKGRKIEFVFIRLASFKRKPLFYTRVEIISNTDANLCIKSDIDGSVSNFVSESDPRVAGERESYFKIIRKKFQNETAFMEIETNNTHMKEVTASRLSCRAFSSPLQYSIAEKKIDFSGTIKLTAGKKIIINRLAAYVDSRLYENPLALALQTIENAEADGYDTIVAEQKDILKGLWGHADIDIAGGKKATDALCFAEYALWEAGGVSPRASIGLPAKGLSGEGYEGHSFWDTEIYMFPFFLISEPEVAKSLLSYRYRLLPSARENAITMGAKRGALFSWRTIDGPECSGYFPSGSAQYHINTAVSHAVDLYYEFTGDLDFVADKGIDILVETSRFWLEIGHYGKDGYFRIEDVTGPDEYTCLVNNNFYTNVSVKQNLAATVRYAKLLVSKGLFKFAENRLGLTEKELSSFEQASERMFLPYDAKTGINPQDDTFLDKAKWDLASTPTDKFPLLLHFHPLSLYRKQVCKQADVILAYLLYPDVSPIAVQKQSYAYYEPITTHDSTLSCCIFSTMASRLGMPEKGLNYFERAAYTDLENSSANTRDGLHEAALGGALLCLACGFGGMKIDENGLSFDFSLPKEWNGYSFKMLYRSRLLEIIVKENVGQVNLLEGDSLTVFIGKEKQLIRKESPAFGKVRREECDIKA